MHITTSGMSAFKPSLHCLALLALGLASAFAQPEAANQPPIIVGSSATLRGTLLPGAAATRAWFEWGTNGNLTFTTPATNVGPSSQVIQIELPAGTIPRGQLLQCRMVASNSFGITRTLEFPFGIGKVVRVWGSDSDGQTKAPSDLSNTVAVVAGGWHGLALQNDGAAKGWGLNVYHQTEVPPPNSDVVAIAGGPVSSMILTRDGTVKEWGAYNQFSPINPTAPNGVDSVLGISQNARGASVVKTDGICLKWTHGAVSVYDPRWQRYDFFSSPPTNAFAGSSNFVATFEGPESVGIRVDKTVAWSAAPYPLSNIVSAAWGSAHLLMLKQDGTVIGFGVNTQGQLNIPANLSNVVAITAGGSHSVALKSDGSVVTWGNNSKGQLNVPSDLRNVIAISAAAEFTVALAANGIPTAKPVVVTEAIGRDILVELAGSDADGDVVAFRIKTLPVNGTLYQFNGGSRGAQITATNTLLEPVGGSPGMVIYAPDSSELLGVPADAFEFAAFDGSDDSPAASATINVVLPPYIKQFSWNAGTKASSLVFSGVIGVSNYTVKGSTNLIDWISLGSPVPMPADNWSFDETGLGSTPYRFYKITSP